MREVLSETLSGALRQADAQARRLNQEYVGVEHLLLGLIGSADSGDGAPAGVAGAALKAGTDLAALRNDLLGALPRNDAATMVTGRLPLSPRAQGILSSAVAAAHAADESIATTRFMLIALLAEPGSAIVDLIRRNGGDVDQLGRGLRTKPAVPEI